MIRKNRIVYQGNTNPAKSDKLDKANIFEKKPILDVDSDDLFAGILNTTNDVKETISQAKPTVELGEINTTMIGKILEEIINDCLSDLLDAILDIIDGIADRVREALEGLIRRLDLSVTMPLCSGSTTLSSKDIPLVILAVVALVKYIAKNGGDSGSIAEQNGTTQVQGTSALGIPIVYNVPVAGAGGNDTPYIGGTSGVGGDPGSSGSIPAGSNASASAVGGGMTPDGGYNCVLGPAAGAAGAGTAAINGTSNLSGTTTIDGITVPASAGSMHGTTNVGGSGSNPGGVGGFGGGSNSGSNSVAGGYGGGSGGGGASAGSNPGAGYGGGGSSGLAGAGNAYSSGSGGFGDTVGGGDIRAGTLGSGVNITPGGGGSYGGGAGSVNGATIGGATISGTNINGIAIPTTTTINGITVPTAVTTIAQAAAARPTTRMIVQQMIAHIPDYNGLKGPCICLGIKLAIQDNEIAGVPNILRTMNPSTISSNLPDLPVLVMDAVSTSNVADTEHVTHMQLVSIVDNVYTDWQQMAGLDMEVPYVASKRVLTNIRDTLTKAPPVGCVTFPLSSRELLYALVEANS